MSNDSDFAEAVAISEQLAYDYAPEYDYDLRGYWNQYRPRF